ncbi:hypothetical protein BDZ97DRAFT_1924807 [Flammula alnicola]|nr:hypothetical protein BDZ97DRAFT_1924807 [Flammula alnicola]
MSSYSTQPQPSRSYGHYIDSNPSSTHSSPRSFPADLEPYPSSSSSYVPSHHHSQTYPLPAGVPLNPYVPVHQCRPHPNTHAHNVQAASRSSSYSSYTPSYAAPLPLQVSTSTSSAHEHDPNERTARPGNAHVHAQFHSALGGGVGVGAVGSGTTTTPGDGDGMDTDGSGAEPERNHAATTSMSTTTTTTSTATTTDYTTTTPGLSLGFSRPLMPLEQERLAHLDRLKFFLATAPARWDSAAANASSTSASTTSSSASAHEFSPYGYPTGMGVGLEQGYQLPLHPHPHPHPTPTHPALNRFLLPNQEFVTFEAFGRPVRNMKKFEEGVFSDLRNLKPGVDACLEEPKVLRPHDRLFLDALERDLKRSKMGLEPTTHILGEPAQSFTYDPKRSSMSSLARRRREGGGGRVGGGGAEGGGGWGCGGGVLVVVVVVVVGSVARQGGGRCGRCGRCDDGDEDPAAAAGGAAYRGSSGQPELQAAAEEGDERRWCWWWGGLSRRSERAGKGSEEYQEDAYERGRSLGLGVGGSGGEARFSSSMSRERRPAASSGLAGLPMHTSMMEEFGEQHQQEQQQRGETAGMSAAEMFIKQARGELPGRAGGPPAAVGRQSPAPSAQRFGLGGGVLGHSRGRSFDLTREHSQARSSGTLSAGYNTTTTFAEAQQAQQTRAGQQQPQQQHHPQQQQQPQQQPQGLTTTGLSPYEAVSADGKVRAFVCPLYSCGRLFKRMEHLKRHLRTHTMERPFTSLAHARAHGVGVGRWWVWSASSGMGTAGEWMDGGEDADASGEGSASGGSPRQGSVADSDDDALQGLIGFGGVVGGMEMYGDSGPLGMVSMDMSQFNILGGGGGGGAGAGGAGFNVGQLDATMCEVEVQGGVQDVQGDEEGLLMRTGGVDSAIVYRNQQQQVSAAEGYFSSVPSSAATSGLLFSSSSNASEFSSEPSHWLNRPQPSPAFSNISVPSPQTVPIPLMRNNTNSRSSLTSSPASYLRNMQQHHNSHSSSSSASSAYGDDFSAASLSAPSHKLSFDHATLYPPGGSMVGGGGDNTASVGGNVGPVRRHRSMTPSLTRNGEPIRRPMTANGGGELLFQGGSPGSVTSSIGSSRGYHPYAAYGTTASNSGSRANSTHSSPQVQHAIPLGSAAAEYAQMHNSNRSESRNSGYGGGAGVQLHEQMRQMMNMNLEQQPRDTGVATSTVFGDGVFRTGSPASFHQTESPAAFSMDLPLQYPAVRAIRAAAAAAYACVDDACGQSVCWWWWCGAIAAAV